MTTTPTIAQATITVTPDGLTVAEVWAGVDRPQGRAYGLPDTPAGRKLAKRLQLAMLAGVVSPEPTIGTDRDGRTYVIGGRYLVMGRTMNADLKRQGF